MAGPKFKKVDLGSFRMDMTRSLTARRYRLKEGTNLIGVIPAPLRGSLNLYVEDIWAHGQATPIICGKPKCRICEVVNLRQYKDRKELDQFQASNCTVLQVASWETVSTDPRTGINYAQWGGPYTWVANNVPSGNSPLGVMVRRALEGSDVYRDANQVVYLSVKRQGEGLGTGYSIKPVKPVSRKVGPNVLVPVEIVEAVSSFEQVVFQHFKGYSGNAANEWLRQQEGALEIWGLADTIPLGGAAPTSPRLLTEDELAIAESMGNPDESYEDFEETPIAPAPRRRASGLPIKRIVSNGSFNFKDNDFVKAFNGLSKEKIEELLYKEGLLTKAKSAKQLTPESKPPFGGRRKIRWDED